MKISRNSVLGCLCFSFFAACAEDSGPYVVQVHFGNGSVVAEARVEDPCECRKVRPWNEFCDICSWTDVSYVDDTCDCNGCLEKLTIRSGAQVWSEEIDPFVHYKTCERESSGNYVKVIASAAFVSGKDIEIEVDGCHGKWKVNVEYLERENVILDREYVDDGVKYSINGNSIDKAIVKSSSGQALSGWFGECEYFDSEELVFKGGFEEEKFYSCYKKLSVYEMLQEIRFFSHQMRLFSYLGTETITESEWCYGYLN